MKKYTLGFVCAAVLAGLVGVVSAQGALPTAPAGAPAAAAVPTLTELEQTQFQLVAAKGQLAQNECGGLDSVKGFNATRAEFVKRVETAHAGYTINFQTGKLVAKAPVAPAVK